MKIPSNVKIGETLYRVRKKLYLFRKSIGGQINYGSQTLDIRFSGVDRNEQDNFFHEIAHGMLKELEFNNPKIVPFRNNENFVQEMGLLLRKTFLDLLKKQKEDGD